jgi:hypothetical protein
MVFYPFEFDERIERYITDFDADDQYFSDFLKGYGSPYYDESTFYDKFSSFSSSDNFFVLHHNIRSAPRNLTSLMSYLKCLSMDFSLIGLSETWFSEGTIDAVRLPGYKHVYNLRKTRGGGVSIFIRDNLRILEHPELSVCHDSFESIFVELPKGSLLNYKEALFIGVVYRPPRYNHDAFNNHLVNILQTIRSAGANCMLMGDFNYDLLSTDTHAPTHDFLESLYCQSFLPLINRPTRICGDSVTLLDNIFFNDFTCTNTVQGILVTDISDHYPVFCNLGSVVPTDSSKVVLKRNYSLHNISSFKERLSNVDWSDVIQADDCQASYTFFNKKFSDIYSHSFPLTTSRSKYKERLPWLSRDLREIIKQKNKWFKKCKRNPTVFNKETYRSMKNDVMRLMRSKEKEYYHELFERFKKRFKKVVKYYQRISEK